MNAFRHRCHAIVILTVTSLGLSLNSIAAQAEWTWIDRDCKIRTRGELESILTGHRRFLLTGQGARADLTDAILRDAPLDRAVLTGAILKGADLTRSHLSHAQMGEADLRGSVLEAADLTYALLNLSKLSGAKLGPEVRTPETCKQAPVLSSNSKQPGAGHINVLQALASIKNLLPLVENIGPATMAGASFEKADLTSANLQSTDLRQAKFNSANLNHADLSFTKLTRSDLTSANLDHSNLSSANVSHSVLDSASFKGAILSGADFTDTRMLATELAGADLHKAHLSGAVFEPKSLPDPSLIATADGLDRTTYSTSPASLSALRAQFQSSGFRDQERQVTYALMVTDASHHRRDCRLATVFQDCTAYLFNTVFFEWTCLYGKAPGRPLIALAALGSMMTAVYFLSMHFGRRSGIWVVGLSGGRVRKVRVRAKADSGTHPYWKRVFIWLRRESRLARAAMFFSLMTAFNIGYHELNVGRWLSMLTRREYELKAVGWTRTAAGLQSLISVYLLALWLLTYFGHPFAQ